MGANVHPPSTGTAVADTVHDCDECAVFRGDAREKIRREMPPGPRTARSAGHTGGRGGDGPGAAGRGRR
jgi:hypothetical protein